MYEAGNELAGSPDTGNGALQVCFRVVYILDVGM